MHRLRFLLVFLFLCTIRTAVAQPELSPMARVSILTCDSGNEIYALFGHTAIRIQDPATALDIVFNYGAFDFRTPNFELKFSRGDLQYFINAESFDDFLMQYNMERRSVWEQELHLSYEQKSALLTSLSSVLNTDERYYTYKFIDRNCTNMAVHKINEILGSDVIVKQNVDERTYRDIIFPYFDHHFYEQWGTSVLFGAKVDKQATTLFLPSEFMHSLKVTRHQGKPLAGPVKTILQVEKPKPPVSWWNNIWTYLAIMAAVLAFHRKSGVQTGYFAVMSVLGLLFAWAMVFSLHEELRNNYNILLFNPLLLWVAILDARKKHKSAFVLSLVCLAFLAIYLLIVITKAHFWIVLPLILANVLMLTPITKKNRKK